MVILVQGEASESSGAGALNSRLELDYAEGSYFLELDLSGSGKNALLTRHWGQGSVRISRSAERVISVWPQSQHL